MTQPVELRDVFQVIAKASGDERLFGQAFDVGVPEAMTYREMMTRTSQILGVDRPMLGVPILSPRLSRLWVSLITGAPRELVDPLVESLRHSLTVRDRRIYDLLGLEPTTFDDAIRSALTAESNRRSEKPRAFVGAKETPDGVRSVQRLPLPSGRDARWVAAAYMSWLPRAMWPFIVVEPDDDDCFQFRLRGLAQPLLILQFAPDRSQADRQLFYVVGGWLTRPDDRRGRLEMRIVPGSNALVCAIHDFRPRLPWFVYLASQAWIHVWVMHAFARHLRRLSLSTA
jgi:hypothetical protein